MKKQMRPSGHSPYLALTAIVLAFSTFNAVLAQDDKSPGKRYGTREPQTCTDMKAPEKGPITADLAAKYFTCKAEGIYGQYLYLVENVKVEVGVGRPYNPNMDINVPEIDVRFPIYPIRGSFTKYQCKDPQTDYIAIPGRNSNRIEHPNAKGFCYRTTLGDWSCYMVDSDDKLENYFPDVKPPRAKMTSGKPEINDSLTEVKSEADTEKDDNGFVKPDFSEFEKYFDIIRYEYVFATRDLYIIGKMKKANNPNKWLVEFFDADGARLKWGNTVLHHTSGPDPQVGQVVKVYAGTPTEKLLRDEVKKIVITRILD